MAATCNHSIQSPNRSNAVAGRVTLTSDVSCIRPTYSMDMENGVAPTSAVVLRRHKNAVYGDNMRVTRHHAFTMHHHRRSLSESDLLHEIDNALVFSKGFLYSYGNCKHSLKFMSKKIVQNVCIHIYLCVSVFLSIDVIKHRLYTACVSLLQCVLYIPWLCRKRSIKNISELDTIQLYVWMEMLVVKCIWSSVQATDVKWMTGWIWKKNLYRFPRAPTTTNNWQQWKHTMHRPKTKWTRPETKNTIEYCSNTGERVENKHYLNIYAC